MSDRNARYAELVLRRKACDRCPGLTNPSVAANGVFDCDEVGPFSLWQGNLSAELVVVAKDFAPVPKFLHYGGRPGRDVETNRRLPGYLKQAGFDIGTTESPARDSGVFMTNAALCLAGDESMRTAIPGSAFRTCGQEFLKPLLDIISPKAVVTLGGDAFDAVLSGLAIAEQRSHADLIMDHAGIPLPVGGRLFPVPHPVASKKKELQNESWRRIGMYLGRAPIS